MTAYRWSKLLPPDAVTDRGNHRPDLSDAKVLELRESGLSRMQVAERLGVSLDTVKRRTKRARSSGLQRAEAAE
jgi:DNA-directed RNA polymerase specialized sigma24 family protein